MTEGTMGTPAQETLTDAERAELENFRETQRKQAELAKQEAERAAPPVTHRLFLDDGSVVESAGVMTNYKGHAVLNAAPIS